MTHDSIIDQIFASFRAYGGRDYGESISVLDHSLQAAYAAEQNGAAPALVAAAVLHDYGHLIHDLPEDIADQGIDGVHEAVGAAFLAAYFGPDVIEPVRLHVAAKRYLCAIEPAYLAELSLASAQSLLLQGGPFDAAEIAAFEATPYFFEAVWLRRYDDIAKEPGAWTPDLEHYRGVLMVALRVE
ncbi:MAG: HD domain-containing protein [Roseiflexaceae bacterium]